MYLSLGDIRENVRVHGGPYSEDVAELFKKNGIVCDESSIKLRHYYPWAAKTIPYASIVALQRITLAGPRGRARFWSTANPHYWANLDMKRTKKSFGLIIDVGKRINPYVTPDDTDTPETLLRERAHLAPAGPTIPSPYI